MSSAVIRISEYSEMKAAEKKRLEEMKRERDKKAQEFRKRIKCNSSGIKRTYFINPEPALIVNPERNRPKTLRESVQIEMP